jgi:hypothetical protein
MRPATFVAAESAKNTLANVLRDLPELRGIGIAVLDDGFGVKVNLTREVAAGTVPNDVDGVPVVVSVIGTVEALQLSNNPCSSSRNTGRSGRGR